MEWKNPPGESWGLAEEAKQLRSQPGRWGMIVRPCRDAARKQRERILSGTAVSFRPKGSFEATLRDGKGGACELYIRYIGEEGEYGQPATGAINWAGEGPGGGPADPGADEPAGAPVDLSGTIASDRAGHV